MPFVLLCSHGEVEDERREKEKFILLHKKKKKERMRAGISLTIGEE